MIFLLSDSENQVGRRSHKKKRKDIILMEFRSKPMFHQHLNMKKNSEQKWVIEEDGDRTNSNESESIGSFSEDSVNVSGSSLMSSSSELGDDASSSPPSSSSSNGPLFELSDLMADLPIKRGLSKFYEGKSRSFTSLANANNLEDLAKKGTCLYRMKMKSWKSFGGGSDRHKSLYSPKATISKKSSSSSRTSFLGKSSFGNGFRPSSISVMK